MISSFLFPTSFSSLSSSLSPSCCIRCHPSKPLLLLHWRERTKCKRRPRTYWPEMRTARTRSTAQQTSWVDSLSSICVCCTVLDAVILHSIFFSYPLFSLPPFLLLFLLHPVYRWMCSSSYLLWASILKTIKVRQIKSILPFPILIIRQNRTACHSKMASHSVVWHSIWFAISCHLWLWCTVIRGQIVVKFNEAFFFFSSLPSLLQLTFTSMFYHTHNNDSDAVRSAPWRPLHGSHSARLLPFLFPPCYQARSL